ncbi:MAG: DUF1206 domain-containing protein [Rhodospirillaceae bacterium]|nr:DUF1206 domain-containing protein [Rhodospirillaceae bacterium]
MPPARPRNTPSLVPFYAGRVLTWEGRAMGTRGLKLMARLGYGSRGAVYLMIGGLATLTAIAGGGETVGSRGAVRELLRQPFGEVLVIAISLGLFCYAGWRVMQSLFDAEKHGTGAKGLVIRAGLFVSAATHGFLGVYALSLVVAAMASQGEGKGAIAWLMQQSFGPYLVGLVGLLIVGAGCAQVWKGARRRFHKYLEFSRAEHPVLSWICGFGLIARGVVFCLIGGLACFAAVKADPQQAGGMPEAMSWLRRQPFGQATYAAMAFGLFAFGIYSLVEARWRRIRT